MSDFVLAASGFAALKLGYDARGKLASLVTNIAQAQPTTWSYGYDTQGYLRTLTDPLLRTTTLDSYDAAGRLLRETLPGGRVVDYGYDANGNLTSLTPPGRPTHTFGYDPVDLTDTYTPPALAGIADPATRYEYDGDRLLERVTRPDGGVIDPTYAAATGLLETVSHPRGQVSYAYTSAASGRLPATITATDTPTASAVTLAYTYDGPLLKSESWSGAVSGTVALDHDADFRVSHQHVGGDDVAYTYDPDGLLSAATVTGLATLSLTRGASGLVDSTHVAVDGGSLTSSARYDSLGQLMELHYSRSGAPYFHQRLERDALGRITRLAETWGTGTPFVRDIHYDAAGRLDSIAVGGARLAGYSYDANGNRVAARGVTAADTASATYDVQDRMLRHRDRRYSYTAHGELAERATPGDTLRASYDALGNLRRAILANGDTITYAADGLGRRVARRRNGTLERAWLYEDDLSPVLDVDVAGGTQNRYVYATLDHAPDLLVRGTSGTGLTAHRVVTDHLGSVRAVVAVASGAEAQRIDYDAWGVKTLDTAPGFQALGYAGGLDERATGLVRFGARDYEPGAGRWTSKDPVGFAGGSLNVFGYVAGRPLDNLDTDGLRKRPARWPYYRDWGGPGWTNGTDRWVESEHFPHLPGQPGFRRPTNSRDELYRQHDVDLSHCARICDPKARKRCRKEADLDLAYKTARSWRGGGITGDWDERYFEFYLFWLLQPNNNEGEWVP